LGGFVNRARDLARQAASFIDGDDEAAVSARREVQRQIVLLYALLRQYLRGERDLHQLGVPITEEEREALLPAAVRPNLAAHSLTRELVGCLRAGRISEQRLELMDANVTALVDLWGGAERIMKTPIPFAYAQHIKAFLTLFCLSVPFAMVDVMGRYTPIAAAVL